MFSTRFKCDKITLVKLHNDNWDSPVVSAVRGSCVSGSLVFGSWVLGVPLLPQGDDLLGEE